MKLYYAKGACSLAERIVINILGLPFEFEAVNLATHQTETGKDFYTINPKGAVPTIVLNDGNILSENSVILQYLADTSEKGKILLPEAGLARYRVLEWLNYVSTELHKGCSPFFNTKLPANIKEEIFKPMLLKKLDYLEKNLAANTYLTGNNISLADCYLFVILTWLPKIGVIRSSFKHIEEYFNRLNKLPAVQKSLEQEGLNKN